MRAAKRCWGTADAFADAPLGPTWDDAERVRWRRAFHEAAMDYWGLVKPGGVFTLAHVYAHVRAHVGDPGKPWWWGSCGAALIRGLHQRGLIRPTERVERWRRPGDDAYRQWPVYRKT